MALTDKEQTELLTKVRELHREGGRRHRSLVGQLRTLLNWGAAERSIGTADLNDLVADNTPPNPPGG